MIRNILHYKFYVLLLCSKIHFIFFDYDIINSSVKSEKDVSRHTSFSLFRPFLKSLTQYLPYGINLTKSKEIDKIGYKLEFSTKGYVNVMVSILKILNDIKKQNGCK